MHNLRLLLIELCLLLLELPLLDDQILTLILRVVQFLSQLELRLIHLLSEVLPGHLDLLELDFALFGLLDRHLLFFLGHVQDSLFIGPHALDLDLQVDRAIPDLSVLLASGGLLRIHVVEDLLLLLLVLMGRLLLTLS